MFKKIGNLTMRWVQMVVLASVLVSCRLSSDLSYIKDTWPEKKLTGVPKEHSDYKLKVNDNLYVSIVSSNLEMNDVYNPSTAGGLGRSLNNVWQTLPGQYLYGFLVEPEGTISLPAFGKIDVSGLTLLECEAKIKSKAEEYLKEVVVKVRLLSHKVTVMGEVTTPGVYYNYNPEFTIFDALTNANGVTAAAKLDKVLVLRRTEDGSKTITINLKSETALGSEAYFMEPNDVVIVPPAYFRSAQLSLPFYTTLLSTITTFVLILNFINNTRNQ
jgi:polysaccharide biosynthesis/export protein